MNLIEFTGPTGCGKTTLLPIVKGILQKSGDKVYDVNDALSIHLEKNVNKFSPLHIFRLSRRLIRANKITMGYFDRYGIRSKYSIEFMKDNINLSCHILNQLRGSNVPHEQKRLILEWFFITGSYYQFFKDNLSMGSTLLFDEGFVQKIVSLFVSCDDIPQEIQVKDYLQLIPCVHMLVHVDSRVETCFSRMKKRGVPIRLKGESDDRIIEFIRNSKTACDIAVQNYRSIYQDGCVITIENDADIESSISAIKGQLKRKYLHHIGTD